MRTMLAMFTMAVVVSGGRADEETIPLDKLPMAVSVAVEGGEAVLAVKDAGHGGEAYEVGQIFEPFFRSTASRRQSVCGLGLGLAVAARIVC